MQKFKNFSQQSITMKQGSGVVSIWTTIVTILMVSLITSCSNRFSDNDQILTVANIMDSRPDSAYKILSAIKNPESLSRKDYAAWCLQYIQARYKLKMGNVSDSMIKTVVDYYKDSQFPEQSGRAYYLWGCYTYENKKYADAINLLKEAESILKNTNENNLKGLVDFNIAFVYNVNSDYKNSKTYLNKSLKYFIAAKNYKNAAYSYREIAFLYTYLHYPIDSGIINIDKAIKYSLAAKDTLNYHSILFRKGLLLYNSDCQYSKRCFLIIYNENPDYKTSASAHLARIYNKLDMPDSVRYYLNITLANPVKDPYYLTSFVVAAEFHNKTKEYKKAYDYLCKAYSFEDSLHRENIKMQIYRADKEYDLSKKQAENDALIIANRNKIIWIAALVIAVLIMLSIFLIIYVRQKRKEAFLKLEKQRLVFESETNRIRNDQKRDILLLKLTTRIENTLKFNKLKKTIMQSEKRAEFIDAITQQSIISENEWPYYISEVSSLYDNKIELLKTIHPELTNSDLIVISLICLNININDACLLLDMIKNTMYTRRKTIKKRLQLDSETELEEWINENLKNTAAI